MIGAAGAVLRTHIRTAEGQLRTLLPNSDATCPMPSMSRSIISH